MGLGLMGVLGLQELIVIFIIFGGSIFWVWMLVDCATKESNEGNEKVVWVVIIAVTHLIGAVIYFFVRRPKRKAALGR